MLVWLMGHFAGRPTVEGKVTREELIAFGVLSAFAKVRHIHFQEKVLVNLLSFVFFFSSIICIFAFSFFSKALSFCACEQVQILAISLFIKKKNP